MDEMWFEEIASLDDMTSCKAEFVAEPGVDVEWDGILDALGIDDTEADETVLSNWFDRTVAKFEGRDEITVFRHMSVDGFDAYIASLEAGTGCLGSHWSCLEDTWSPSPEGSDVDVLVRGCVDAAQVDWFTTFQRHLSHPWEEEVAFSGSVKVTSISEMVSGRRWLPTQDVYPTGLAAQPEGAPTAVGPRPGW